MIKKTNNKNVLYTIEWSDVYHYDRYTIRRILPELSGILCIGEIVNNTFEYKLFYSCWRDGCRLAFKKLIDPALTKYSFLQKELLEMDIYYKYTILDSSIADLADVMYWLIGQYKTEYNNLENFKDSQRYLNISVRETNLEKGHKLDKIVT